MMEALEYFPRRRSTGLKADFPGWKMAWEDFFHFSTQVSPFPMNALIVITLMQEFLDTATIRDLKTRMRFNLCLTYAELNEYICKKFEFDPHAAQKNRWKRFRLKTDGEKNSMQGWRSFPIELQAAKALIRHFNPVD